MLASATGRVFTGWKTQVTPNGMSIFEVKDATLEWRDEHDVYGPISPSSDGQIIYAAAGHVGPARFDVKCQRIGEDQWAVAAMRLPATTGPFYLVVHDYFAPSRSRPMSLSAARIDEDR